MAYTFPHIENADIILKEKCLNGIDSRFDVDKREKALIGLGEELAIIRNQDSASGFIAVKNAFDAVNAETDEFCVRGTLSSLLINYVLGLSEIDPINCSPKLYPEIVYSIKGDRLPWFEFNVTPDLHRRLFEYFDNYPGNDTVTNRYDEQNEFVGIYIGEIYEGNYLDAGFYDAFSIGYMKVENEEEISKKILSNDIINICKPQTLEDYVKCFGFIHGTGVWEDNEEMLFKAGNVAFADLIANREDVYEYLLDHGVERQMAFTISEYVRKGKVRRSGWKDDMLDAMYNADIPQWFIDVSGKIGYLFTRAQAMSFLKHYCDITNNK